MTLVIGGVDAAAQPLTAACDGPRGKAARARAAGDLCGGEQRRAGVGARERASCADSRTWSERSKVGPQGRPPQGEPPAGAACRDALTLALRRVGGQSVANVADDLITKHQRRRRDGKDHRVDD
ncbi:MAG: hypothetical protein ACLGIT_10710 [Gammaproteobacteria bacterium]